MLVPTRSASSSRGRVVRDPSDSAAVLSGSSPRSWRSTGQSRNQPTMPFPEVLPAGVAIRRPPAPKSRGGALGGRGPALPDAPGDGRGQVGVPFIFDDDAGVVAVKAVQVFRGDVGAVGEGQEEAPAAVADQPESLFLDERD